MDHKWVFFCKDYRKALKKQLAVMKDSRVGSWSISSLAEASEVQRPYMSKVINMDGHLNDDQFFLSLEFLQFTRSEIGYLQLLHQYQRSKVAARRKVLKHQLDQLSGQYQKVDEHLAVKKVGLEEENVYFPYFLDPHVQLVHVFLTIPTYLQEPTKIIEHLDISQSELQRALGVLVELGLIEWDGNNYLLLQDSIYLPASSVLWKPYKTLVKNNGLVKTQKLDSKLVNSLALVFSCSEGTWINIREKIIGLITEIEQEVTADKEPELVLQFNLDFLPWNRTTG